MVDRPLFLPGGKPARTSAEIAYVRALQAHGRARTALGAASEVRKEAFTALQDLLAERGPVDARVEEARRAWRTACAGAYAAAAAVRRMDQALEAAVAAWASECAASYARREAAHG